eukprot:Nk52_evm31s370 gene=Nk52_evmTU31s370
MEDTAPYEGPRAAKLRSVMRKALEVAMIRASTENARKCFPPMSEEQKVQFDDIWAAIGNFVQSSMEEECDTIMEEENARQKLNELDVLLKDADKNVTQSRIFPTPEATSACHTVPAKEAEKAQLLAKIEKIEAENKEMQHTIEQDRQRLQDLEGTLEKRLHSFQSIEGILEKVPLQELKANIIAMEKSLS